MTETFKAACIQNCATPDVDENLGTTLALSRDAAAQGASLICLPEYFSGLETRDGKVYPAAFAEADHPVIPAFAEQAKALGVWVLLGSLGVTAPDGRINNRGYLIDPAGQITARYDKIHMFDVNLGEDKIYRESATIAPGDRAVVAETPWGGLGLSICYDLRFAALYRALAHGGAKLLAVPAAFTRMTGEAHWHVLNRARAIETGSFVIAPCQYGTLDGGAECFGHSLIIDPWGRVLADGGDSEGFIVADIDMVEVDKARSRIPSLSHDRPFSLIEAAQAAE
ncbi:MAG: carbon-nitrogen hydrolase family protein [Hyphomicrobiales bacterium]